ncbi:MAG: exosortase-associated EpsI family protein [Planctomycetota bacterium]
MRWFSWNATVGLVVIVTILSGWMQGTLRRRWGISDREKIAAKRLMSFPTTMGDWATISEGTLDEVSREILQPSASLVRTVRRGDGGTPVAMTLIVGPPGYVGAHTPEVCTSGSGYEQIGSKEKVTVVCPEHPQLHGEFWVATFRSRGVDRHLLREYWAWSTGGQWEASSSSRLGYGLFPYLYKAQFSCRLPAGSDFSVADPIPDLLREFIAESGDSVHPATKRSTLPITSSVAGNRNGVVRRGRQPVGQPCSRVQNAFDGGTSEPMVMASPFHREPADVGPRSW